METQIIFRRQRFLNMVLILSIVTSFFILPTPAKAGFLSKTLNVLRPMLNVAGKIGGAVIGASMAAAIVPPLGMLAGGILGWIAGGVITHYATGSLSNLATVGGGVIGAMALGPGVLGTVGGFLLGGFLGRIAMKLIKGADKTLTGGVLFSKGNNNALAPSTAGAPLGTTVQSKERPVAQEKTVTANQALKTYEDNYKKAYQDYITAAQSGDSKNAEAAHKVYLKAYQEFQDMSAQTK